ncbi:c-type cytochrome [Methylomagnum sp.]
MRRGLFARCRRVGLALLACGLWIGPAAGAVSDAARIEIGKQIYLTGRLPSGKTLQATVAGDVPLDGAQVGCAGCHKRSRMGSSEGGNLVPPVTAAALFRSGPLSTTKGVLPQAFRQTGAGRPPYTDESFARALREGINPAGRPFSPFMPRYAMDDQDIAALAAYLESAPPAHSPGVSDSTLHIATVVGAGVDPAERKAMLDVLETYFHDKNAETRHDTQRNRFSAYKMYQVYKRWQLHVWELKGSEATWPAQLAKHYRAQPVFATLGGLGRGVWQPVHQFCERFEVACLFPNTDVPVIAEGDFYSVYFSKGLTVEAEALAKRLGESPDPRSIAQVFRRGSAGAVAAAAFRRALSGSAAGRLQDIGLGRSEQLTPAVWRNLLERRPANLVLWLDAADLDGLDSIAEPGAGLAGVYLSASLAGERGPNLPDSLGSKLYLTYPWQLPDSRTAQMARARDWLKSRRLPFTHERLQANTFCAAVVLGEAVKHLLDNFSSAYLIERIEGMIGNLPPASVYPRLSLGTGQRFASKGSYIARIESDGKLSAVGGWIVP